MLSDRLMVNAMVDETDLSRITIKQKVTIKLDAFASSLVTGKVDSIAYEARTVSNVTVYDVKIAPDAVPDFFRSGMTASVIFDVKTLEKVLTLPSHLIENAEQAGKAWVLVPLAGHDEGEVLAAASEDEESPKKNKKHGDHRARLTDRKLISIGVNDGKRVEVLEGLSEGDVVLRQVKDADEKNKGSNPFMPNFKPKKPK